MKKLIIFLIAAAMAACNCLGQLPTQYLAIGDSCEALLPDYRTQVTVRDNCEIDTVTQVPAPGLIMGPSNPYANVVIEAIDVSGNRSNINFDVVIDDTIPPEILVDSLVVEHYRYWGETLTRYQTDVLENIDRALVNFPDSLGMSDSLYVDMNMLTVSSSNLTGKHWGTFYPDTLTLFPLDSAQMALLGYTTIELPIHVVR